MMAAREEKFGPVRYLLQRSECIGEPACCLVAAVFRGEAGRNANGAESGLSH